MNKFRVAACALVFFSLSTTFVLAESTNSTNLGTSNERGLGGQGLGFSQGQGTGKDRGQDQNRGEGGQKFGSSTSGRPELKNKDASTSGEFKKKAITGILNSLNQITKRFDGYIAVLDKIAGKIQTRIDKLKAKGVDTSTAEAKLAQAKLARDAAVSAITEVKSGISGLGTDPTKDQITSMRLKIEKAKKSLFDYHKALVDAVKNLKAPKSLREGSGGAHEGTHEAE